MSDAGLSELKARLKAVSLMLRFGHDLFEAKSFDDTALLAVNNSAGLLNFTSSSIVELTDGRARVAAQYGQVVSNHHSRLAVLQKELCCCLKLEDHELLLTADSALAAGLSESLRQELLAAGRIYYILELRPPAATPPVRFRLFWLLEFAGELPTYAQASAKLLSNSIAEALYYRKLSSLPLNWRLRRHFRGRRLLLWLLLALLAAAMFLPVRESATAEFSLRAPVITPAYAWFDGLIAECKVQDGARVEAGEVVAEYDRSVLDFRLAAASNTVREAEAELELEKRSAFTDRERLGKLKLLEARLAAARLGVEEAQWYLDHAALPAPTAGILALADGRAELLAGRAVRTGDRLFDILGGEGMQAEIPVDEQNSSLLTGQLEIILFLHTAPETPIKTEILAISSYPELTEQRTYCYLVRAKLPEADESLRYGMRGVAKLKGGRVCLGYHLFKNLLLFIRRI